MDVDAVKQRAGELALITCDHHRRAGASLAGISIITTGLRVFTICNLP